MDAGKDVTNMSIIYGDVLRQQAQLRRHGILQGADEYAEDGFKSLVSQPTSDHRVQAWNAFMAKARMDSGLSATDYGLSGSLTGDALSLYKQLCVSLKPMTTVERTPDMNFALASKALKILFDEDEEDQDDGQGEAGADGETGEGQGEGSEGGEQEGEGEGADALEAKGTPRQGDFQREDKPHLIGKDITFTRKATGEPIRLLPSREIVPNKGPAEQRVTAVDALPKVKLSHKVATLLKVFSAARYRGGHKTGKINKRSLATIPSGNERVFRKKEQKDVLDTAVMLLVDSSGSMSGERYTNATGATLAMHEVLNKLHIPHAVMGFTYSWDDSKNLMYNHHSFGEWKTEEALKFSMCDKEVSLSGNADGESLLYAYDILAQQKQKRKIMIVLSDGQPADGVDPDTLLKRVTSQIEQSRRVELYAIGIQTDSVKDYYSNCEVIKRACDIEEKLLSVIKNAIIK